MLRKITDKQLGELLIERGLISNEQLGRAIAVQKKKGGLIGEILVILGYIKETDIDWALDRQRVLEKKGTHKLIGEILVERGCLTKDQLERGLAIQKEKGGLIGEILVALGYVQESDIAMALTSQYGFPYLPLESYEIDPEIIKTIPEHIAMQYLFIPIDKFGNNLSIAMCNPLDSEALQGIESFVGCNVQVFVSTATDIKRALKKYYKETDK